MVSYATALVSPSLFPTRTLPLNQNILPKNLSLKHLRKKNHRSTPIYSHSFDSLSAKSSKTITLSHESWYNLGTHELLELHCSSPPTTFARALVFGHMLVNGGSTTVNMPTQSIPALASQTDSFESTTATLSLATANPPRLASLPRNDLAAYLEPYWEGWVRVPYVVWRPEVDSPPKNYVTEAVGLTFPGEDYLSQSGRRRNDRLIKVQEWRERWAVIRNGVLRLCKTRNVGLQVEASKFASHTSRQDPASSWLPALCSLSGAEYFSSGRNDHVHLNQPASGFRLW